MTDTADILYVVLPYFNYARSKRREELLLKCVERLSRIQGVCVVISESVLDGGRRLSGVDDVVFMHCIFEAKHAMWHKENLVNLAVRRLPENWKYMTWIDADLTFTNPRWVQDTVEALRTHDIVQMFSSAVDFGPEQEILETHLGFAFIVKRVGSYHHSMYRHGLMLPGLGWAMTRAFFEKIGGLTDWAILGYSDHHTAMAIVECTDGTVPYMIHQEYKDALKAWAASFRGVSWGYVPGTVLHDWHGKSCNRKYKERWGILIDNNYVPSRDLECTEEGLLAFTPEGERLNRHFMDYFRDRRDDDVEAEDPPQIRAITNSFAKESLTESENSIGSYRKISLQPVA